MQQKLLALIILASCAYASGSALQQLAELPVASKGMREALRQAQAAYSANPSQRNSDCIADYMSDFNEATVEYQKEYEVCGTASNNALQDLNDSMDEKRQSTNKSANDGCAHFSACNGKEKNLDFFNCYGTATTEANKQFNDIKINSDTHARDIRQNESDIKYQKDRCDTTASDSYKKKQNALYDKLLECMKA